MRGIMGETPWELIKGCEFTQHSIGCFTVLQKPGTLWECGGATALMAADPRGSTDLDSNLTLLTPNSEIFFILSFFCLYTNESVGRAEANTHWMNDDIIVESHNHCAHQRRGAHYPHILAYSSSSQWGGCCYLHLTGEETEVQSSVLTVVSSNSLSECLVSLSL